MEDHIGHRKYMYLTTIIASVAYAGTGCVFSWTSPTLPRLMKPDSILPISEEQGSWIASIIAIGGTIGPLVSGKLLDNLGRKWIIVLDALLLLTSWAILGFATCVEMLYIGRFVAGFAVALLFTGGPMYISEISDDFARPMLTSSMELSLTVGFNIPYFAGPFLSYKQLIIAAASLPLIFIMIFIWLPETPYYLIAKEKKEEAIKSLQWFRGNISRDCAEKEIVIIESTMYETMQKKESFWKLMKLSSNQRSMAITCFLMTGQQFSGINVIQVYAESIFMSSGTKLNPAYCAIIFGICQFLSSALAAPLTKSFGFKKPLMVGSILIAIEHFVLGLFFYFLYIGKDVSFIDWLPLTCLILYIVTYSATYGPLPWGVLSEMFPTDVKAAAASVVVAVNFSTTFLVTKFFTNISSIFGTYLPFWIFTGFMTISFFFIQTVQPNTKGMSLQDIQDELKKKKIKPSINPS